MSRSGYVEDFEDDGSLALYRGAVESAIQGKRGQAFLCEMAAALDAMAVKELVAGEIVRDEAHVCAIGSVAIARKMNVAEIDEYDGDEVGRVFGIAASMAREIAFVNDDDFGSKKESPAERWTRVRAWVDAQIRRAS